MTTVSSAFLRRAGSVSALVALAALAPLACTVTTTNGPVSNDTRGNLRISWTVAGTSEPAACASQGASTVVLQVSDLNGVAYGGPVTAPCTAFSTTITDLPAGTYSVSGYLANAANQPLSGTVPAAQVTVTGGLTAFDVLAFPGAGAGTPIGGAGSLALTWVVASTVDPGQCAARGAASLLVQLTDTAGQPYGAPVTLPCAAFAGTVPNLPPGVYALSAQMVGAGGLPVSTAVGPVQVDIVAATATAQALDFPASAFVGPSANAGALVATWSIAGTTDPAQCAAHGAVNMAIQLVDPAGSPVGSVNLAPCGAFTATLSNLVPGSYGVTAQLLDAANQPASTAVGPVAVSVVAGSASAQAFAFPADAFTR